MTTKISRIFFIVFLFQWIINTNVFAILAESCGNTKQSAENIKDPLRSKTFVDSSFDSRRIFVIYDQHSSKISYNSKTVCTIINLLHDGLREYSFQVFLQSQFTKNYQLSDLLVDKKTAMKLARQKRADAVVLVSTDLNNYNKADAFVIHLKIDLKAFDVTTGKLLAYEEEKDNDILAGTLYTVDEVSTDLAEKITPFAVEKLVKKIVRQFTENRTKFTVFMFQNVQLETQDQIIDLLQEMSWDYKIESQLDQYLELSIYSEESPSDLRQHFRKVIKKHGIYLKSISFKGARAVFSGR